MGTFGKSFTREIGKNTGKWVSNKVFGDGHATPHKLIHTRLRENVRKEREDAIHYREQQKQIERERRENEKRMIQQEKEMAAQEKQQLIEANIREVEEHNNYINVIQSVHKDYSTKMNWEELLNSQEPEYVETLSELEDKIEEYVNQSILNEKKEIEEDTINRISFGVKFFQKITKGKIHGIITRLFFKKDFELIKNVSLKFQEIDDSKDERIKSFKSEANINHQNYLQEKENYHKMIDIAKGVIEKDKQSYTYALNFFKPFEDLKDYGSDISFNLNDNSIVVNFFVHGEDVIPKTTKKVLRKGLEVKEEPIPTSRFNEIYQDYVCSCILRIAKEIFQLLPNFENVKINAKGSIINSSTGNYEEKTIVSSIINQLKLNELNFDLLDPSDSILNFEHRMEFKKTEGFKPIEEIN